MKKTKMVSRVEFNESLNLTYVGHSYESVLVKVQYHDLLGHIFMHI